MKIDRFEGDYDFLSNFYVNPLWIRDREFMSAEHAFQYFKPSLEEDRVRVLNAPTPGDAKKIARRAPMRTDWERIKLGVMYEVVTAKFHDPKLKAKLLATGDAILVEGNWWGDKFWGVMSGEGANWLGRILMLVRSQLASTV